MKMPVRRLLTEMDSYELSAWRAFLPVRQEWEAEQQRRAQEEARIEAGG
jgi:hypothetical protein